MHTLLKIKEDPITKEIDVNKIKVAARTRSLGDIADLVLSINERGLFYPIMVTPDLALISGCRRLAAFKELGISRIPATIRTYNQIDAELAALEDNLTHKELSWLERGEQLARLKQLYEARHPETRKGNTKAKAEVKRIGGVLRPTFTKEAAARIKVSDRKIQKHIKLIRDLPDNVRDLIRPTQLSDSPGQLAQLAKHDHKTQLLLAKEISRKAANCVKGAEQNIKPCKLFSNDASAKITERLKLIQSEISKANQNGEFQNAVDKSSPNLPVLLHQIELIQVVIGDWVKYHERKKPRHVSAA
jgi:ParB family chromosome partitioning protein